MSIIIYLAVAVVAFVFLAMTLVGLQSER